MSDLARAESLPNTCEPANALFITKYGPMTCAPNATREICRGCCDDARSEPPRRSARHPSSPEEGSVFENTPPDPGGVAPRGAWVVICKNLQGDCTIYQGTFEVAPTSGVC